MKNNPFDEHGVEYLSPTSINKFRKDPCKWIVNVAGYTDRIFSPAMTFGIAIEDGITFGVLNPDASIDDCYEAVRHGYKKVYARIYEAEADQHYEWEKCNVKKDQIQDTIDAIIPSYREFGIPIDTQKRVELEIEELPIPIIGYVDYLYDDYVRDLKTTGVIPKVRSDYQRQLTFYAKATEKMPILDFVYATKTKKEMHTIPVENIDDTFQEIKRIAMKMMNLLSLSSDIREVARLSCLEPDITNEDFSKQWGANEILGAKELFMY